MFPDTPDVDIDDADDQIEDRFDGLPYDEVLGEDDELVPAVDIDDV